MKIEIKHRFTLAVLFTFESDTNTLRITVEAAIKSRANLYGADLSRADLSGANLSRANLSGAECLWADVARRYVLYHISGRYVAGCRNYSYDEAIAHWTTESIQPDYVRAIEAHKASRG